jgi:hypothetical protein
VTFEDLYGNYRYVPASEIQAVTCLDEETLLLVYVAGDCDVFNNSCHVQVM